MNGGDAKAGHTVAAGSIYQHRLTEVSVRCPITRLIGLNAGNYELQADDESLEHEIVELFTTPEVWRAIRNYFLCALHRCRRCLFALPLNSTSTG